MVGATHFTGSGLRDWLIQRATAVVLAFYTLFLFVFYLIERPLTYHVWHTLFSEPLMKVANIIVLLAILAHAWIGIWTVVTDYVKPLNARLIVHFLVALALLSLLAFGLLIFLGVPT